jgi:hypothetical protein
MHRSRPHFRCPPGPAGTGPLHRLTLLILRGRSQSRCTGQTVRGLKFTIYLFIFLRSAPEPQSAHEWDLELVSGANCWCNLHYFSSRGRSRGSRGPPWAPRGRKSNKKPGAGFIMLSSLRSPRCTDLTSSQMVMEHGEPARQKPTRGSTEFGARRQQNRARQG